MLGLMLPSGCRKRMQRYVNWFSEFLFLLIDAYIKLDLHLRVSYTWFIQLNCISVCKKYNGEISFFIGWIMWSNKECSNVLQSSCVAFVQLLSNCIVVCFDNGIVNLECKGYVQYTKCSIVAFTGESCFFGQVSCIGICLRIHGVDNLQECTEGDVQWSSMIVIRS